MKQFGWSRIALITQSENIFTFVSITIDLFVMKFYYQCLYVHALQIAERLRLELATSNLQLTREYTFTTEGNAKQAVEALRVCKPMCYM